MAENYEQLLQDVDSCVESLESPLLRLSERYSPLAAVIGMALHANAILRTAVDRGQCDREKAQHLLRQLAALEVDPAKLWGQDHIRD